MFQKLISFFKNFFSFKSSATPKLPHPTPNPKDRLNAQPIPEPKPISQPQPIPEPKVQPQIEVQQQVQIPQARATEGDGVAQQKSVAQIGVDRTYFGPHTWPTEEAKSAQYNPHKISQWRLPPLDSEQAVADWLGISLSRLRWFTHNKTFDPVWHYTAFYIPKRSGGQRTIIAPKRELKAIQRKILHDLLALVPQSAQAHGFTRNRSILTNAEPHIAQPILLNLDLKDFFPSITYPRVRGLFISLGYSFAVSSVLALLCTEYERSNKYSTKKGYLARGSRYLVQGAPTSPAISNLIAQNLDRRLNGLAKKNDFQYTRYADDLTFSGADKRKAMYIQGVAQQIIEDEDFEVNRKKTRLYPSATRQIVTGIVVNEQLSTPRQLRRHLRAILKNARRTGLEAQNRDGRKNFRAHIRGLIEHVRAVNPEQGEKLLAEFNRLL